MRRDTVGYVRWEGLFDRGVLRERSDSIDTLRATLAAWVLIVHLAEWGPLSATGSASPVAWIDHWTVRIFQSHGETHPAVLAFIVLSGYCIHRAGARHRVPWSSAAYAIKRFFRIWPVYIAACALGAVVFELTARSHRAVVTAITATSSISVGCTATKVSGVAAFVPSLNQCAYQGNAPLATVMVEIWLYVVYGVAVWLLLRRLRTPLFLAIVVASYLIAFAYVYRRAPADTNWWDNSSLLGYLPYWWIGAGVVAVAARRRVFVVGAAAASTWGILTAATWNVAVDAREALLLGEVRKLLFAVSAAGVITALDFYVRRLPAVIAGFGRSGYSLYAFHAPILVAAVAVGAPWWAAAVAAIGIAVSAYRLYERPLLLRGRALAKRQYGSQSASAQAHAVPSETAV